ncbi:HEAT repeat domain-containing protein [candidate division KSB1 bacterium]|nr:HEAT repeat domain-containing protein [candidate division KSB1 bacterium]
MNYTMKAMMLFLAAALLVFSFCAPKAIPPAMPTADYLASINNPDPAIRAKAVDVSYTMGNDVIVPLGELLEDTSRSVAQSAFFALEQITAYRSRPDAGKQELTKFNQDLLKLVDTQKSTLVNQQILRLLGQTCGKKEIPQLKTLLADSSLFESTRWALEQIAVPEAGDALLEYLEQAPETQKADIILTLGAKNHQPAAAVLHNFARGQNKQLRLAAYDALSKLADAEAATILLKTAASQSGAEQIAALKYLLRLADNCTRMGNPESATGVYTSLLEMPQEKHIELAALTGLGKSGNVNSIPVIAKRLESTDSDIQTAAIDALISLPDKAATDKLVAKYDQSQAPELRKGYLRAITLRDAGKAQPLVLEAAKDSDLELRALALSLFAKIDAPNAEKMLFDAIESEPGIIRQAALHACVELADTLARQDHQAALKLYHLAIEKNADSWDIQKALNGICNIGDAKSIPVVEPLLYVNELSQAAASFYFQLAFMQAEQKDFCNAEKLMMKALGVSQNRNMANAVLFKIKQMGGDSTRITEKIGFVSRWWVVGPFRNKNDIGETIAYFPEKNIDFSQTQVTKKDTIRWQKVELNEIFGVIPLALMYSRNERLAYAYTELEIPEEIPAIFKIGSNDGVVCWLNGKKVHENFASRGLTVDEDEARILLKKGRNKILAKVLNKGGNWEFCLRICDASGKPINLQKYSILPE